MLRKITLLTKIRSKWCPGAVQCVCHLPVSLCAAATVLMSPCTFTTGIQGRVSLSLFTPTKPLLCLCKKGNKGEEEKVYQFYLCV